MMLIMFIRLTTINKANIICDRKNHEVIHMTDDENHIKNNA